MAFAIICKCGKKLKVSADHAGKRGKCPACGKVFTIPAAPAEQSERPSPEPARPQATSPPVTTAPTVDVERRTVAPKPARRWPLYVGSSAALVLLALAAFMFAMRGGGDSENALAQVAAAPPTTAPSESDPQQVQEVPESETEEEAARDVNGEGTIEPEESSQVQADSVENVDEKLPLQWVEKINKVPDDFLLIYAEASRIAIAENATPSWTLPLGPGPANEIRFDAPPPPGILESIDEKLKNRKPGPVESFNLWAGGAPSVVRAGDIWQEAYEKV